MAVGEVVGIELPGGVVGGVDSSLVNDPRPIDSRVHFVDVGREGQRLRPKSAVQIGVVDVPIAIRLCPMKVLADPTWGVANKEFYVDIDKKLTNRWCKLFAELNRLVVRTNKIESSKANWAISSALGEFLNLVFHYHGSLQEILCRNVDLFRSIGDDEDVVGFANTAENHPLFNPRQLDQWLNFKSAELEMFHSMVCRIGMGILFCGLFKLGEQPMMPQKKYSLVLYVPPLDDFTHAALKAMQKFAYDPYRYFSLKKENKFESLSFFFQKLIN